MALKLLWRGDKSMCSNGMERADFSDAGLTVLVYFGQPPPCLWNVIYWQRRHHYYINPQRLNQKVACECVVCVNNLWMLYWLLFMFRYYSLQIIFHIKPPMYHSIQAIFPYFQYFRLLQGLLYRRMCPSARPGVGFGQCVSWNNMMLISNRDSHRRFLISDNDSKAMHCDDACHAIMQS